MAPYIKDILHDDQALQLLSRIVAPLKEDVDMGSLELIELEIMKKCG